MADSKEKRISDAFQARLSQILIANNFETDAGANVFRGLLDFTHDDPIPALSIIEQDIEVIEGEENPSSLLTLPIVVMGWAKADRDNPSDAAHQLIADIKKGLFLQNERTIGDDAQDLEYRGRTIFQREPGSKTIFVTVSCRVRFVEIYGDPFT